MAKTDLDLKAWLADLGFTKEEAEDLAPKFEGRRDKLAEMQMRQSDYDRRMNEGKSELAKTRDQLAAQEAKLNADMAEWAELTASEQAKAGDLRQAIDAREAKIFDLTQKLTRLAEDHGVDPKTVLGEEPPKEPAKPKEPATVDLKPIEATISGVADYLLTLNAELPAIAEEHFRLTGQRLDTRAFVAGIKADLKANKTANLDPVKRWETQYEIPAKRQAAADAAIEERIVKARAEERAAVLSEQRLPDSGVGRGTSAPVFKTGESKIQRPQPSQKGAGALAALTSHKYAKSA